MNRAFSPRGHTTARFLGRWPRLVWNGPLALMPADTIAWHVPSLRVAEKSGPLPNSATRVLHQILDRARRHRHRRARPSPRAAPPKTVGDGPPLRRRLLERGCRKWIAVESELDYVIGSALALHARLARRRRGGIHARAKGPTHPSLGWVGPL